MSGKLIQAVKPVPATQQIPVVLFEGLQDIKHIAKKFNADGFPQVPA